jgi:oligopeptide transport system substrate-binding protein
MFPAARNIFPYVAFAMACGALAWAVSFGTLPPADFAFNNGDEVKTVDPPKATGAPEGRIIFALFDGLYRSQPIGYVLDDEGNLIAKPTPDEDGNVPMKPVPATASGCEISDDGTIYTFTIRANARWSDGSPVTADDFVWSWRRMLHPETASRYAYQLYYIRGARQYNEAQLAVGDHVEVELGDRPQPEQLFPRGTLRRGVLKQMVKPPEPTYPDAADDAVREQGAAEWREKWTYLVDVKPEHDGQIDWSAEGETVAFTRHDEGATVADDGHVAPVSITQILPDFSSTVGVRADDERTLVVTLNNRTPYFLDLVAFYPLFPVNRNCIEQHGVPNWTKPRNLVGNGPYLMQFRRIRDRVRLVKNPHFWNARAVRLETIDAMAIKSETTGLNMFLNGQLDWTITVPTTILPDLQKRSDFLSAPALITYFYRLNINRPPLDDIHVRRAMNMAIEKRLICEKVMKAGQQPARSFVPPGLDGYDSPLCEPFDASAARAELAKSKYLRNGKPLPKITILYNTNEAHRSVAEVIQQMWKNNLGIDVELKNSEWATFLDAVHQMDYTVARAGWIGDYPDPNTFLDMWVTGGQNNETGWSDSKYDQLIRGAEKEPDPQRRSDMLEEAEAILMNEMPVIPIYFYVSINMVNPDITGFYANIQDLHPLHLLRKEE